MNARREIVGHLGQSLHIRAPVVVSRAGFVGLVVIDTVMSGRAGTDELAYYGIASGPQLLLSMVGIGLMRGAPVLTAQACGAGEERQIGVLWRVVAVHASVLSLLLTATADLARGGGEVMRMFAWSMPFYMVWISLVNLLEGMGRTIPAMAITSFGVAAKAGLNWVFIFGNAGLPAMGAEGAQFATSLVCALMLVVMIGFVFSHPDFRRFALLVPLRNIWQNGRTLRRLGYPMGLATGIESMAHALLTIFAGLLGKVSLAAFQTTNSLVSLVFMIATGVGAGTAVRVAQALGRGDQWTVVLAAWAGTGLGVFATAVAGGIFLFFPAAMARLYVDEPQVIALAEPVFQISGAVLLFMSAQTVQMGALRGVGDVWFPTGVQFVGGWGLMIPVGAALAFSAGLMIGLLCSVAFTTTVLVWRFRAVSRRQLSRL